MSRKKKSIAPAKADRRARRTREVLGDALVGLMHEKPFQKIKVNEVLKRAEVGRSTFYSHYRDKEDLFLSDVDDFWASVSMKLSRDAEASRRVAPVRELFEHVGQAREFYAALVKSEKVHDVMDLGIGHFARGIEQRLKQLRSEGNSVAACQAISHSLAGALFSMLFWWLDRSMPLPAAEMDALYHRLAWSGAVSALTQATAESSRHNSHQIKTATKR
ncbi:MAG TPA: TetR/AcrR family transcriptional regulator [Candidatus Angelobacter sp.]